MYDIHLDIAFRNGLFGTESKYIEPHYNSVTWSHGTTKVNGKNVRPD